MQVILLIIIILQLAYIVYKDISNSRERESLQLKLMSRDVAEYRSVTEKAPEDSKAEEEVYVPVEDISYEQALKAKDK